MTSVMALVANAFKSKILPSVVALYYPEKGRPQFINQVGTGFLTEHDERPVVVTAAHVLLAKDFKGKPDDICFHWNGKVHYFNNMARVYVTDKKYDVAAFYADELATKPRLPSSSIVWPSTSMPLITVGGYKASKFVRKSANGGTLSPMPLIHTDIRIPEPPEFVSVRYSKKHIKSTFHNNKMTSIPIPEGLSGGPMLDTISLLTKYPKVVGVFTGHDKFRTSGCGSNANVVQALLAKL